MAERVEHHFNGRHHGARRDIYLIRAETGWQVVGRIGSSDCRGVTHYFDDEGTPAA
jgi:hypothetical protein